jgi:ubiquinone/menaquinone biosynthesis C-methylase UbiE
VAAGTGEQTILAARRVGSTGSVLATDIAAQMLTVAADAAEQAGLSNVTTRVMDAQRLDVEPESFDAVISRLGLMFVPDLPAALAGIRRALKRGG